MSNEDQSSNPDQTGAIPRPIVRLAKDATETEPAAATDADDTELKTPQLPSWLQKGSVDTQPEPEAVPEPEQVAVAQEEPAATDVPGDHSSAEEAQSDVERILETVIAEENDEAEGVDDDVSSTDDSSSFPIDEPESIPVPPAPMAPT